MICCDNSTLTVATPPYHFATTMNFLARRMFQIRLRSDGLRIRTYSTVSAPSSSILTRAMIFRAFGSTTTSQYMYSLSYLVRSLGNFLVPISSKFMSIISRLSSANGNENICNTGTSMSMLHYTTHRHSRQKCKRTCGPHCASGTKATSTKRSQFLGVTIVN